MGLSRASEQALTDSVRRRYARAKAVDVGGKLCYNSTRQEGEIA